MITTTVTLLTKKELAVILKASIPSIDRWMKTGKIPYIKVGRKVLFNQETVMEHLNEKYSITQSVHSDSVAKT